MKRRKTEVRKKLFSTSASGLRAQKIKQMKYFLIAGERSGDLHGANLIRSLKAEDPNAEIRCWGGEQMEQAGATLLRHYSEIAVMAIWEVIVKLFTIFRFIKECHQDIRRFQPDVVILIDFGGFNMKIAGRIKEDHIPSYYYISPKIWAWNTGRAHKIKRLITRMFCILPFEKDFYRQFGYDVDYVGNPVVDAVVDFKPNDDFMQANGLKHGFIALLPGSRRQEIIKMLPLMVSVARRFPEKQFAVAAVKNHSEELYDVCRNQPNIRLIFEENYNLLHRAHAAIVTSGTATLETALFNVPQVVVYKTSLLSYIVGKIVLKVRFLSLVNLIADKEVVKELIQAKCNEKNLADALEEILDPGVRTKIFADYEAIQKILGKEKASQKAARLMVNYLRNDVKKLRHA